MFRLRKNYPPLAALLLTALGSTASSVTAVVEEHTVLVTLLREPKTIDRIAAFPVAVSDHGSQRHHFDYVRLSADVHRISIGVIPAPSQIENEARLEITLLPRTIRLIGN